MARSHTPAEKLVFVFFSLLMAPLEFGASEISGAVHPRMAPENGSSTGPSMRWTLGVTQRGIAG